MREFARLLRKSIEKVSYHLGAKVEAIQGNTVIFSSQGKSMSLQADLILMSVGRRPNVEKLKHLGLDIRRQGIKVNEQMQTNLPGVYAIGDVNGESLLAHSASRMAEVAVNTICGQADRMRYHCHPLGGIRLAGSSRMRFDRAGRAATGIVCENRNHADARQRPLFWPNMANARRGCVKVVVDAHTNVLKGIHLFGAACSEMIYGARRQ